MKSQEQSDRPNRIPGKGRQMPRVDNGASCPCYPAAYLTPTAKTPPHLQARLNVHWILHNFLRPHFTTKLVPAVALGILERGLSMVELLSYPLCLRPYIRAGAHTEMY